VKLLSSVATLRWEKFKTQEAMADVFNGIGSRRIRATLRVLGKVIRRLNDQQFWLHLL
jgi:hypothetical protein